jgi:integrase
MARGRIVVRKRKDGSPRYYCCIRIEGKQRYKSFRLKRDAENWLDRNATDAREGTFREVLPASFREYTTKWRAKYLTPQELKPSTLGIYNYLLDRHLIAEFGPRRMTAITTADITDLRARLLKEQSPASVKKVLNVLNRVFDDAIEDGYLRVSPMPTRRRKTDKSTKGARRGRALTPDQAQRLLAECDGNDDLRLAILIGVLGGLRRGEIFALSWSDIDFEGDVIRVRCSLHWAYGRFHKKVDDARTKAVISTPKSACSVREVDLSPRLKDALWARYMEMKMADKRTRGQLIFECREGGPYDPGNVVSRWFIPAVERAVRKAEKDKDDEAVKALTELHFHDLRHTFGSWLVASGQDILYVSAQMGHARPSITADVYSHLLKARRPHAAKMMDEFLFGKA